MPPGTGVMAETMGSAAAKSASPRSPSGVMFVPTSTTTCPGAKQSGPSRPACPAAATTMSAPRQTPARSRVFEWQSVTVASRAESSIVSGLPTTRLRPTTATRLPRRGMS